MKKYLSLTALACTIGILSFTCGAKPALASLTSFFSDDSTTAAKNAPAAQKDAREGMKKQMAEQQKERQAEMQKQQAEMKKQMAEQQKERQAEMQKQMQKQQAEMQKRMAEQQKMQQRQQELMREVDKKTSAYRQNLMDWANKELQKEQAEGKFK